MRAPRLTKVKGLSIGYDGSRAQQTAGLRDVPADLFLESVDAGKAALLAEAVDELDAHAPAVDVRGKIEQVHLERERRAAAASGLCDVGAEGRV